MPIFDDCRAKCTMRTTLEADVAYTHLISNGDIDPATNPDLVPVRKPGQPDRQIITFNNPIPMPPYLFIACAGTWDVLRDGSSMITAASSISNTLFLPAKPAALQIPMKILQKVGPLD